MSVTAFGADIGSERHYRGSLGAAKNVYLRIVRDEDSLEGSYMKSLANKWITLRGSIRNGKILLSEFDPARKGAILATFEGAMKADSFKGMWKSIDGKLSMPFAFGQQGSAIKRVLVLHELSEAIDSTEPAFIIAAYAPKLSELQDPQISDSINHYLAHNVHSYSYAGTMPGSCGMVDTVVKFFSERDYSIEYLTDKVISVSSNGNEHSSDSHPLLLSWDMVLNIETGKPLKVQECFKKNKISKLNGLISGELRKTIARLRIPQTGEEATEEKKLYTLLPENTNFVITPHSLIVSRNETSLHEPRIFGDLYIPLEKIKDAINPDGPIGEVVR